MYRSVRIGVEQCTQEVDKGSAMCQTADSFQWIFTWAAAAVQEEGHAARWEHESGFAPVIISPPEFSLSIDAFESIELSPQEGHYMGNT